MDLTSLVKAKIKNYRPGMKTWFDALPTDAQKALGKVRDDYAAGAVQGQKRAIARAIILVAKDQGWAISGEQRVLAWLDAAQKKT
jgi:hypothetical protein